VKVLFQCPVYLLSVDSCHRHQRDSHQQIEIDTVQGEEIVIRPTADTMTITRHLRQKRITRRPLVQEEATIQKKVMIQTDGHPRRPRPFLTKMIGIDFVLYQCSF
jgi:hypothetical protein